MEARERISIGRRRLEGFGIVVDVHFVGRMCWTLLGVIGMVSEIVCSLKGVGI